MNWTAYLSTLALSVSMSLGAAISSKAQQANMSFFVASVGSGKGADLGGLPGADQHCLRLAQAAGAGNHTWHAYLSAQGCGDSPNRHDALTGTQPDGRAFPPGDDRTCHNWTSSTQGTAIVGHIDRQGLRDDDASKSWNSSHPSRCPDGGCSQADLRSTGGDGLFYCFATN